MNRLIIPIIQTACLTADLRSASVHTLERPPNRTRPGWQVRPGAVTIVLLT